MPRLGSRLGIACWRLLISFLPLGMFYPLTLARMVPFLVPLVSPITCSSDERQDQLNFVYTTCAAPLPLSNPYYSTTVCDSFQMGVVGKRDHLLSKRQSLKNQPTMAQQTSLSSQPPLSPTKDAPKPQPSGASRGHTALNTHRGSSLLQLFVVQNRSTTQAYTK